MISDRTVTESFDQPWSEPSSSATILLFKRLDKKPVEENAKPAKEEHVTVQQNATPTEPTIVHEPALTPNQLPQAEMPVADPSEARLQPCPQHVEQQPVQPLPIQPPPSIQQQTQPQPRQEPGEARMMTISVLHVLVHLENVDLKKLLRVSIKNHFGHEPANISPAALGRGFFVEFGPSVQIHPSKFEKALLIRKTPVILAPFMKLMMNEDGDNSV